MMSAHKETIGGSHRFMGGDYTDSGKRESEAKPRSIQCNWLSPLQIFTPGGSVQSFSSRPRQYHNARGRPKRIYVSDAPKR